MTKTISFSAVEILPALLSKKKTQTIRKAWKNKNPFRFLSYGPNNQVEKILEIPPRFSVGNKVKLYWKQGNESDWFCRECGEQGAFYGPNAYACTKVICRNSSSSLNGFIKSADVKKHFFNKLLGGGVITKVFEIEMAYNGEKGIISQMNSGVNALSAINDCPWKSIEDLAKKDGFKSAKDMFSYFDKNYDLSSPKKFHVYRWKWNRK